MAQHLPAQHLTRFKAKHPSLSCSSSHNRGVLWDRSRLADPFVWKQIQQTQCTASSFTLFFRCFPGLCGYQEDFFFAPRNLQALRNREHSCGLLLSLSQILKSFFFSFVMSFVVVGQVVAYILTAFNSSWRLCFNVLVHRKLVYELITKDWKWGKLEYPKLLIRSFRLYKTIISQSLVTTALQTCSFRLLKNH